MRLRLVFLEQEALRRDADHVNFRESEHPMFKASVPVEAHVTVEVTIRNQTSGSGARVTSSGFCCTRQSGRSPLTFEFTAMQETERPSFEKHPVRVIFVLTVGMYESLTVKFERN